MTTWRVNGTVAGMVRAASLLSPLALIAAVAVAAPAGADRPDPAAAASAKRTAPGTTVRFDGIGGLRLGMTRSKAFATGVLRTASETCFDSPAPRPVTYSSDGPKNAAGARYQAIFRGGRNGKLTHLQFVSGVRTELGIRPGVSTAAQMAVTYRRAGYTVRTTFDGAYNSTFVEVRKGRRALMTGVASGETGRPQAASHDRDPGQLRLPEMSA